MDGGPPVLQIFGASIWLQLVNSSGGAIFQSMGRTDMLFKMGILSTITTISATLIGILYFESLTLTALCISIAIASNFMIVYYVLINRILSGSFTRFLNHPKTRQTGSGPGGTVPDSGFQQFQARQCKPDLPVSH